MNIFHVEHGTHIKSNQSTEKMMRHLLIALLPIIIFSFYKNGIIPYLNSNTDLLGLFRPLLLIIVAALTSLISEIIYHQIFLKNSNGGLKSFLKNSYSIIPGIFLALILPLNTPFLIIIFGSFVATIVGKMLFGGFGSNIFNPALIGRLFVISAYAITIVNNGGYLNAYEVDTIAKATPLTNAGLLNGIGTYQTLVAPYGNLWNFLLGTIPGALGETSAILCLIGFFYLAMNKVIKWKIPVVYILTVFVMTYLIGNYNGLGLWFPMFHILSGGLMFGAVFMATDPVTSPTTPVGQILYGLFLGILTVAFRFLTPAPEGVLTAILTMNMLVFIIDRIGAKARISFRKSLIPFLVAWISIVGLGFYIASSYEKVVPNTPDSDPKFTLISKTVTGTLTTYMVSEKGYMSTIKAKIVIDGGTVITYEVLSQGDSFYQKIIDANYPNVLITKQKDLTNADTVSGATFSSTAIKKMLINTLGDYNAK